MSWLGNLPDLILVESDKEDTEVINRILDDGAEMLLARYGDKSFRKTWKNFMGEYRDKWRWLS